MLPSYLTGHKSLSDIFVTWPSPCGNVAGQASYFKGSNLAGHSCLAQENLKIWRPRPRPRAHDRFGLAWQCHGLYIVIMIRSNSKFSAFAMDVTVQVQKTYHCKRKQQQPASTPRLIQACKHCTAYQQDGFFDQTNRTQLTKFISHFLARSVTVLILWPFSV